MEYMCGSRTMYSRAAKTKEDELTKKMINNTDLAEDFEQMCVEDDQSYEPSLVDSDTEDDSDISIESDCATDYDEDEDH